MARARKELTSSPTTSASESTASMHILFVSLVFAIITTCLIYLFLQPEETRVEIAEALKSSLESWVTRK
jgi:hypothetical protein